MIDQETRELGRRIVEEAIQLQEENGQLRAALKKIEDLALRDESSSYKWGAAFQIVTNALHRSSSL